MALLEFDEKLAEQMEVVYRSRDILRRRRLVYEALDPSEGDRVLDAGCGPGFYAAELLERVGERGPWSASTSEQMLAVAAHRCGDAPNVTLERAEVTSSQSRTRASTARSPFRCSNTCPRSTPPSPSSAGRCAPVAGW